MFFQAEVQPGLLPAVRDCCCYMNKIHRAHSDIRAACVKLNKTEEFKADVTAIEQFHDEYYFALAIHETLTKSLSLVILSRLRRFSQRDCLKSAYHTSTEI